MCTNRWRAFGSCSSTCLLTGCRIGTLILWLRGRQFYPLETVHLLDPDSLHRGRGRKIKHGQKIHASVAFSPSTYCPKAVLPKAESSLKWEDLIQLNGDTQFNYPKDWEGWLEMDIFDPTTAQTVINNLESSSVDLRTSVHRLTVMTQSGAFSP